MTEILNSLIYVTGGLLLGWIIAKILIAQEERKTQELTKQFHKQMKDIYHKDEEKEKNE